MKFFFTEQQINKLACEIAVASHGARDDKGLRVFVSRDPGRLYRAARIAIEIATQCDVVCPDPTPVEFDIFQMLPQED